MPMIDKIELFRNKRQLSMQELAGTELSHSTYSRFVSRKTRLAADTFIYLLKNMDLSFQELSSFDHPVHLVNQYKLKVQQAISANDVPLMQQLKTDITPHSKWQYDSYEILTIRLDLKIGDLTGNYDDHGVKEYLNQVNDWTFKEMYLFQLLIHQYDTVSIYSLVAQQIRSHIDKEDLERNINLILLLHRTFNLFLERQEIKLASQMVDALNQYIPPLGFTTMRFCYAMDKALLELVKAPSQDTLNKIQRLYTTSHHLNCPYLANELAGHYEKIQTIYGLPELESDS